MIFYFIHFEICGNFLSISITPKMLLLVSNLLFFYSLKVEFKFCSKFLLLLVSNLLPIGIEIGGDFLPMNVTPKYYSWSVLDSLCSEQRYCYNNSHVRKLGWPGLEFTVFITINLEGCLSQIAGVGPAIYSTYRIAMPSYIASALPP